MRARRNIRGGSTPSFDRPPVLVSLLADFDAASGFSPSVWTARSGGVELTQPVGALRPSTGSINGHPSIAFPGAGEHMSTTSLATSLDGLDAYTVYHVGKLSTVVGSNKTPWGTSNLNDHYNYVLFQGTTGVDGVPKGDPTQTFNAGTQTPLVAAYDHVAVFDGANNLTWLNGVASVNGANSRAPVCNTFSVGTLLIGGTVSQSFNGDIGRLLVYSGAHDAATRLVVRTWLRNVFGI